MISRRFSYIYNLHLRSCEKMQKEAALSDSLLFILPFGQSGSNYLAMLSTFIMT